MEDKNLIDTIADCGMAFMNIQHRANLLTKRTGIYELDVAHVGLGVAGEAGELVDALKKHAIYNRRLDKENIVEELGDLFFYAARIMSMYKITLVEVNEHNDRKLALRYPEGYTDAAAQARADKNPAKVFKEQYLCEFKPAGSAIPCGTQYKRCTNINCQMVGWRHQGDCIINEQG